MNNLDNSNENEWEEKIEFQKETIGHLSEKNDIAKVLATDNRNLNNEKKYLLGYMNEDVLYRYDFEQLDLPETYNRIEVDMANPNIDKAIINGKLYPEAMEMVIEKARDSSIPFSIVQDPEFRGDVALILTKKK